MRSPAARSRRQTSSPSTSGHRDVEDDRVRAALGEERERLAAVAREADVVALDAQRPLERRADRGLVVDDHHGGVGAGGGLGVGLDDRVAVVGRPRRPEGWLRAAGTWRQNIMAQIKNA